MTPPITLTNVLKAVTKSSYSIWHNNGEKAVWPYYIFQNTMIDAEIISNTRKIKEWWGILKEAGYFIAANGNSAFTNPIRIANRLKINIKDYLPEDDDNVKEDV